MDQLGDFNHVACIEHGDLSQHLDDAWIVQGDANAIGVHVDEARASEVREQALGGIVVDVEPAREPGRRPALQRLGVQRKGRRFAARRQPCDGGRPCRYVPCGSPSLNG